VSFWGVLMDDAEETFQMWTVKQADNLEHLSVLAQKLEEEGWTIKKVDTTMMCLVAAKPQQQRLDD